MKYRALSFGMAAIVAAAIFSPAAAQHDHDGGSGGHVDSLAHRVEQSANYVAWELYNHHRNDHHHDYAIVYQETKEMWAVARHCHDLLHNKINNDRLKRNVRELDLLFHHLEEHIAEWDHDYHVRQDGHWHDYVLHGHHHGYGDEHHLLALMADLESSLHHLMDDLGIEPGSYDVAPGGTGNNSPPPIGVLPPN